MKDFNPIIGDRELQERIRKMIYSHEIHTGKKATFVNIEFMPCTFNGVTVEFAKCGDWTGDGERIIQHKELP